MEVIVLQIKDSIRKKYLIIVLTIGLILLILGSFSVYGLEKNQQELTQQREVLKEKDRLISELKDSLNNAFFRARGYYAFQNEVELSLVYDELNTVEDTVTQLKEYELTKEEGDLLKGISDFLITYRNSALPNAIALVQANDYEGLRKLSNSGLNKSVNEFIAYTDDYHEKATKTREMMSNHIISESKRFLSITIFVALFLFLILLITFFQTLKRIVNPLEDMKKGADYFSKTGEDSLPSTSRTDELGALNLSLKSLMKKISENESDMLAQNEELLMQQDELQTRQELLEKLLKENEIAKNRLEVMNQLNHSLTFSLDRQELVQIVREYLHDKFTLDISFLWLVETLESSSKGITEEFDRRFMEERYGYVMERLHNEGSFSIVREGDIELGLAPKDTLVNDFFVAITEENGEMVAGFSCSRIGNLFTKEEMIDMKGLLNRVSLSLERIRLYEINRYERTINEGIVKTIQEGIFLVGPQGELLQYNQSLYDLLSGESHYAKGTPYSTWISLYQKFAENPDDIIAFYEQAIEDSFTDIRRIQYTFIRKGTKVIYLYAASVFSDGIKTSTIFVNRDITKEHEVDQMKTELISTVSHELRTPLSSILGFSELLLSKKMTNEKKDKYIETIYKESKRLSQLVDDFLDVQRMESGKVVYHFTEVEMGTLLPEIVENYAYQNNYEINIDNAASNSILIADVQRITQVFVNLVSNAIKFSPDKNQINIHLSNENRGLKITVQDHGLGISEEEIPKLFQKFHRVDSGETRRIGGTGLGLSIVKEIIEHHQGQIWITSIEGEGTTVHLFFSQRI